MKKALLFLIITLLIAPSLFATVYIRGTAVPLRIRKATLQIADTFDISTKEILLGRQSNLNIQAGLLYEFIENNELGIELGLGYTLIKQTTKSEGESYTIRTPEFLLNVDLVYRHIVSNTLSILGKIGFHEERSKQSFTFYGEEAALEVKGYGMNLNFGLLFAINKHFDFSFGLNLDAIFHTSFGEDFTLPGNIRMKITGISFNPYIGIAYLF